VTTRELTKRYGKETALRGLELQVPEGSVYVLVGPNGAGKSTTFKSLLDLVRPDAGSVSVFGLDPRVRGPEVRAQIGYVPERQDAGYAWMRVGRLLEHHRTFYPSWDAEYARHLVEIFDLRLDRRFGTLSKGQCRRVQLTLALAHRPHLLLLDEPTDGLDPVMLDETLGYLVEHLAETRTTALISTHRVHEVDRLADHVGVIRDGSLVVQVDRATLHRRLRRYRAAVPESWDGAAAVEQAVIRRQGFGREILWTIWGDEPEIIATLTVAGAHIHDVMPVTLEEAAVAFLGRREAR
jgi:ABC-2 type transport system ATP-binding protein